MTEIIFGNTENLHRQRRVPIFPHRLVAGLADERGNLFNGLWRGKIQRSFISSREIFSAGART